MDEDASNTLEIDKKEILIEPSSGQPINFEFLILTTLKSNSTTNQFYKLHCNYTKTLPSFKSASPKAPVQGIALIHAQSHHIVSSGQTTGDLFSEEGSQVCECMKYAV